ncbi:NEL-type E3 ubiquitin ligase domain-containing protein [Pseudomonas sp. Irchel 3E19]|uniref:NEL-type E3 ubiquitin ligase domain-containing protein n=1 Tax=Pseudomonas sp. Irchel 3E19 TaxID=2008981 RepID=UPI000BA2D208|nr:NEL-type E3 ubiquitin ligase domain-containing protein [Pseudomonas sp. Irchel 3E19]
MQNQNTDKAVAPAMAEPSEHAQFIAESIPDWWVNATDQRRDALKNAGGFFPDWYMAASAQQRQTLNQCFAASVASQNLLDQRMANLQPIDAFAAPLLSKALKDRFAVELDVNKTFIQLNKPVELGVFSVEVSHFEALKLPLLQAALHNFEAAECTPNAFHRSSGFLFEDVSPGQYRKLHTTLSVAQFTSLCRDLDIGGQYQAYLKGFLLDNPVAEAVLRHRFVNSQKDALRAAAELALLKKDIEPKDYTMILSVIGGELNPTVDGVPVWFRRFGLMKKRMTGCVLFSISEKYRYSNELILYIPHDPEHPLKRYTYDEMDAELKRQFTARDPALPRDGTPTPFQRFFSQFVAYKDRAYYFSQFTRAAADSPGDPLAGIRSPLAQIAVPVTPLGALFKPNDLPPASPSRLEPEDNPYLKTTSGGPNAPWGDNPDLWLDLYQLSRDKIIDDARHHAVPTADVDARVRDEKIARLLEIGMLVLNGVSMFVPVLGEVMIGVMAGQLLYETFEGSIEWSEGDRRAALAHLTDVAGNLALIAVMHGVGKGAARIKALKPPPVVDSLEPVTLPNGEQRLWKPDLQPYRTGIRLPAGSTPNELGLHRLDHQDILALDDGHYVVRQEADSGQYRIQHPSRPDAYQPRLRHNSAGAWRHEAEEPLTWAGTTLMRRLGYRADAFTDMQLEQVRISSGLEHDQLRHLHVDQLPPTAQLSDTLTRFRLSDELETFARQMGSDELRVYAQADIALQFRVMRAQALLPEQALRVVDSRGTLIWEDTLAASETSRRLVFSVSDQAAKQGSMLPSLLEMLKVNNVDLAEVPGTSAMTLAQRAVELRKEIAGRVRSRKQSLFELLYCEQDASTAPAVLRAKAVFPKLATVVVERILATATEEELALLKKPGPLPRRLYQQAEQALQEQRLSRAYEGLYLDPSSGPDSERLALHSLQALPGWPQEMHLALREYGVTGRLLDTLGNPENPLRATLVVDEQSTFTGGAARNLYASVLQALSPAERQALGFNLEDADKLSRAVQQNPLPRDLFRKTLQAHRVFKPTVEPGVKLLGGGPLPTGPHLLNFLRSPRARVLKLYPDFNEAQVETFLQSLGENVRGGLERYEVEYRTLKSELDTWVQTQRSATDRASLDGTLARLRYDETASLLKRCWRRQSSAFLRISAQIKLPTLSADFRHVETLELSAVDNVDGFLRSFTGVKKLTLYQTQGLRPLPEALGEMKGLTHFSFHQSDLRLDPRSVALLGAMSQLEELDLQLNPLGISPDFSAMPQLKKINLYSTGIRQWPKGTASLAGLQHLDLRGNQLTEVPLEHLSPQPDHAEVVARINRGTLLDANPFPRQVRQQLIDYRNALAQAHPSLLAGWPDDAFMLEDPLPARVRQLYPGFSAQETAAFLLTLGGDSEVDAQLLRLESEYQTLNQQLSAWAFSGGGARQRYVRAGQRQDFTGLASRYEAADRIRNCWRRQSPKRNAVDGTPIGHELDLSGQTLDSVPDLEADFSHVGSLKLNNMGLSVSPEGFLARFRGVRWLDMSSNQLTEIPPALAQMHGLTRLFLQQNRIQLSVETASLLAERTTLRALNLSDNPLGRLPDFSRITDMRSVFLNSAGVDTWPVGLDEQPLLDSIHLRNNQISSLPQALVAPTAERLDHVARLNNMTTLTGNPLSEVAQQQVQAYWDRLERERPDLWQRRVPGAFVYQAPGRVVGPEPLTGLQRWSTNLPADQLAGRQRQWQMLTGQPDADGFLRVLNDLQVGGAAYPDLQQRVWTVIDSITEPTPASQALRKEMFEWAGRPACIDRAALSFSNMEVMTLVYRARALAVQGENAPALLKLSKGLFRLEEVEKIALADIDQRTTAINDTPGLSSEQKAERIALLEEVEIRLAYRFGLKERLGLPGQPQQVRFTGLARVTPAMLDQAYNRVVALDNSAEELQSLLAKDFWKDYVVNTDANRPQFERQREPYQEQMSVLRESYQAGAMSKADFETQTQDLDVQLQIEEAVLIETLTREELLRHPF